MMIDGKLIQGGQNIFFAQLASPNVAHFSADATRYFSGEFIFMIFGLPGAALAMYRTAKPEKKKVAGGLLLSAALTSMFTGITEPIEFSFPLRRTDAVLRPGHPGRRSLHDCPYPEHRRRPYLLRRLTRPLHLRDPAGPRQDELDVHHPVGIIYFFLYYFIFTFLIKRLT